jgi:hypothetical protein
MSSFRHTGVGNAVARTDYAAAGQVQDSTFLWGGTAGGTADALTIAPSPAITAYAAGQCFEFIVGASPNATTTPTLNVNGVGAKTFVRKDGSACVAGDLPAGNRVRALYDGTNFRLDSNPVGGSTSITTLGTITTGTWNATVIAGQYGGTGVANTGKTITLGGNLTTSGANALTLTTTGTTNVTLPTSGTLIAAGSITTSGLTQNTSRLLGRTTASSGAVEEITVGTGLSLSGGSLTNTASSGLVLLATVTPTAAANVDALTTFSSTYDSYLIVFDRLLPASSGALYMRLAIGGVANSSSIYFIGTFNSTPTNTGVAQANITSSSVYQSGGGCSGIAYVHNVNDTGGHKIITSTNAAQDTSTTYNITGEGCVFASTSVVTGIRLFWSSGGNFQAGGSVRIYGIQNS